MDIQEIIKQLTAKFGNSFDITKVTDFLKGLDLKNLSLTDIISKLGAQGLLNDSVKNSVIDGLKDKAGSMLGGIFGK